MAAAIVLNPTHAKVGTSVLITGSGFTHAGVTITFTFGGSAITATEAPIIEASGAFTAHIVIPASVQGIHAVVATDVVNSESASANFTTDPSISVSPSTGESGDVLVTITGDGYASASAISSTFNAIALTTNLAAPSPNASGHWTATFTVPTIADGVYAIACTDVATNTSSTNFTVDTLASIVSVRNSTFAHLNGRDLNVSSVRSLAGRERECIVDIPFTSGFEYVTGGILVDFTIAQLDFKQVYFCQIISKPANYMNFVPGASNDAALGKIKIYNSSGVELSAGDTSLASKTLTARIRGV